MTTATALPPGTWGYPSLRQHLAARFPGQRIRKLCLHAGFSCPNLDGTIARGGCSYCNNEGFAPGLIDADDLRRQWDRGRRALRRRHRRVDGFIAYFQSFSGTHADPQRLRQLYDPLPDCFPECLGASISTRPDCVPDGVLDHLAELAARLPLLHLELGLQSDRDAVLRALNRGHDLACFLDAVDRAAARGLELCAHLMLGLPGEGADAPERLGALMAALPVASVKVHNFHVMADTPLERAWRRGRVRGIDRGPYLAACGRLIRRLRPDQYVQRVIADAPERILRSGAWCHDKQGFLVDLRRQLVTPTSTR